MRLIWFSDLVRSAINRAKLLTAYHGKNRGDAFASDSYNPKTIMNNNFIRMV